MRSFVSISDYIFICLQIRERNLKLFFFSQQKHMLWALKLTPTSWMFSKMIAAELRARILPKTLHYGYYHATILPASS